MNGNYDDISVQAPNIGVLKPFHTLHQGSEQNPALECIVFTRACILVVCDINYIQSLYSYPIFNNF